MSRPLLAASRPVATAILLLVATVAALVLAELLLRGLGVGTYSLAERVLFYSLPAFVGDAEQGVHYAPNTDIRSVPVYGDQIDYDLTQHTNNLGFYDSIDYYPTPAGTRNVVFIGDSFTAGYGGFNWVSRLREWFALNPPTAVFNLGVGGTGIHHYAPLLASFHRQIGFNEVNIVAISNDFIRPMWWPLQHEEGISFCFEGESAAHCRAARTPFLLRVEIDASREALLERARSVYADNQSLAPAPPHFYQQLRLYTLLCDALSDHFPHSANVTLCPHVKNHYYPNYLKSSIYQESIDMLRRLPEQYPGVRFRLWHAPQKGEAILGNYAFEVGQDLAGSAVEYIPLLHACAWTRGDYHKHDGHLNPSGYNKLLACVEQQVVHR